MKKLFPLVGLLSVMALVGCGDAASSSKAPASSSKAPVSSSKAPASSSKAPASSSVAPASSSKASSVVSTSSSQAHQHVWAKGTTEKNGDSKDCVNYTCTCGALKVEMAFTDNVEGAAEGKLAKGSTFTWKIKAPKAGTATFQMFVKYGQTGSNLTDSVMNTIWGNSGDGQQDYTVKVGGTAATCLVNGKTYAETGVTADGASIDIATVTVAQGDNTISFTTPSDQYYRNVFEGNVGLVFAAVK